MNGGIHLNATYGAGALGQKFQQLHVISEEARTEMLQWQTQHENTDRVQTVCAGGWSPLHKVRKRSVRVKNAGLRHALHFISALTTRPVVRASV